jgi:CHAT domain-containing protein/tetratricopeptide (TPR) repeat protein
VYRGAREGAYRRAPGEEQELAQLELLAGRPRRAVLLLEQVVRRPGASAEVLSDLCAAYLALSERERDPRAAMEALDAADLAVALNPRLAEARFNRALAFERLSLLQAAIEEWRRFLELDPASGWASEAETRGAALAAHLSAVEDAPGRERREIQHAAETGGEADLLRHVAQDPQVARELVEEELLPAWAAASATDRVAAARLSTAAEEIARALASVAHDRFLADVVARVRQAEAAPLRGSLAASLAEAHLRLGEGRRSLSGHRVAQAIPALAAAAETFDRLNSPAALLARLHLASCRYQQHETGRALAMLRALAADPRLGTYPSLAGRVDWLTGLLEARQINGARSLAAYDRALRHFQALPESASEAHLEILIAEELDYLGRFDAAWDHRYRALAWSAGREHGLAVYNVLDDTVSAVLAAGDRALALHFQDRLLSVAADLGQPEERAFSRLRRARIFHALDRDREAATDLAAAAGELGGMDAAMRWAIEAEIAVVDSELSGLHDPRTAVADLTRAIEFQRAGGLEPLLPELRRQRAHFHEEAGDLKAAEADLALGIAEVENQRSRVDPGQVRIPLFDQAAPLFEAMVTLQLKLGRDEDAFATAERSRARILLDQLPPGSLAGPEVRWLAAGRSGREPGTPPRLPPRTVVVEFAQSEGRLITWLVSRSGVRKIDAMPPLAPIAADAQGLRTALQAGDRARTLDLLGRLHEALVAPWQPDVAEGDLVVFVPTGPLYGIPFAALRASATGRFLVEDHPSAVAASATVFVAAFAKERPTGPAPYGRALLIANPVGTAAGEGESDLPLLPRAEDEATEISRLYPESQLLLRGEATRSSVLAALPSSEMVHFATHVLDALDPRRARLLLAAGADGRAGDLYGDEIAALRLPRTRLVVLAGCNSAGGMLSASEGALGLAHAFQAAGVPVVLSSLWDLEDGAAARLFVHFHRLVRAGTSPVEALRAAQLAEIARGDAADWTWAALEMVGG